MPIKQLDEAGVPRARGLRGILSSARCEHERDERIASGTEGEDGEARKRDREEEQESKREREKDNTCARRTRGSRRGRAAVARRRRSKRGVGVECGVGDGVVAEWVPPEVGLVGRGVGGGGVGCLGQNQYCGHPSLGTP